VLLFKEADTTHLHSSLYNTVCPQVFVFCLLYLIVLNGREFKKIAKILRIICFEKENSKDRLAELQFECT